MEGLVRHVLTPILSHPDAMSMQTVEGRSSTIIEVIVHDDDRSELEKDGERTLRSVRAVLSAGSGSRKATVELVQSFSDPAALLADEEDTSSDEGDDAAEADTAE